MNKQDFITGGMQISGEVRQTYRLERIAEGAKAMAHAMMAETITKRNCGKEEDIDQHGFW